ncbi:flagellar hook-length control protein FliK [Microbacterium sp. MAHUQ-60]|uniref:flagellar hook-length control protein FliK n=1 Tax=unclassified Microbacterium TaxID=2609290 RepID=UPI00361777F5
MPIPAPIVPATPTPGDVPGAAQPAVIPTGTVAAAASAPPSSPAPRTALLPQVTAPVLALARSAEGQHSITLTVAPENLGPVTVRAHIIGGSIRLELHAPAEAGRDALRAILTDLRRDLAVAAPGASVHVSTGEGPSASSSQSHGRPDGHGRPDAHAGAASDGGAQRDAQGRPADEQPRSGPPGGLQTASPGVPRTGSPLTSSSPSRVDVYA